MITIALEMVIQINLKLIAKFKVLFQLQVMLTTPMRYLNIKNLQGLLY
jgi:hypothetical protein